MFGIIASLVFGTAFALSSFVIVSMFAAYREKMLAALLAQPMPQVATPCHVEIRRRRVRPLGRAASLSPVSAARAA